MLNWYDDPTKAAGQLITFIGAIVTLVTVGVAVAHGEAGSDAFLVALSPVLITVLGVLATIKASKTASKPSTVIEAIDTGIVPPGIVKGTEDKP